MNMGSGTLTLNSNAGGADIFDTGASVTTLAIATGENYIIYNNGNKWVIIN
jgi:hypothetical protein